MLRDSISKGLVAICVGALIAGCEQATAPPSGQNLAELRPLAKHDAAPPTAELLASGLDGPLGSAIGPDGALYVGEAVAGRISRVDPKTGAVTTFASGLPPSLYGPGGGGVFDVAFIGHTAYALVIGVAEDLGGDDIVGIYRVDGPSSFTVVADLGAFNTANPPETDFFIPTGVGFALEPYRHGFLVTDGHLNRVLYVTLDGEIEIVISFSDIVPTGLASKGNKVYMAQAGPVPHPPQDGKVVTFDAKKKSPTATEVASGAQLAVDVEFGHGDNLYVLSQGDFPDGSEPGTPANPNTGALMVVNKDGTLTVITDGLNQPTSLEFIGKTAYFVTFGGEVWKIEDVPKK